jgi:hypothetical protein
MSDDDVTKFRKNMTAIRSRRLSDPQMYAILTAIPIPEISEKALQCAVLAEAGGLYLALTHEDRDFVHIAGHFKKRCECENNPRIPINGIFVSTQLEQDKQIYFGELKEGQEVPKTFRVDIPRPLNGGAVTLTISARSYFQSITVPPHADIPNYIEIMKGGRVFQLRIGKDYPANSALIADHTYEIAYIPGSDTWKVYGPIRYGDHIKWRVCEHKVFVDKSRTQPVRIENGEFGIWGGVMKFDNSGIADGGLLSPKLPDGPIPTIPNAQSDGEGCMVQP